MNIEASISPVEGVGRKKLGVTLIVPFDLSDLCESLRMNDQRPCGRLRMCIHSRLYRIEAVIDRSVTVAMNSDRCGAHRGPLLAEKCLAGDRR